MSFSHLNFITSSNDYLWLKEHLTGTYVDFLVIVDMLSIGVSNLVNELVTINNYLGMDQSGSGINFVGSLIEGNLLTVLVIRNKTLVNTVVVISLYILT